MTATTAVRLACPDWCDTPVEQHQREIEQGDLTPIHQSAVVGRDWILTMMQSPDGTPTAEKPGHAPIMLMDGDDLVHPDDAERLAHALLEMVAQARSQAQPSSDAPPIRSPEPFPAPACPDWCQVAWQRKCRWEPLTKRGAREAGVPVGTWVCDHLAGDVAQIFTFGREFSHEPGRITLAALLDDVDLVEDFTVVQADELRGAAERLLKAAAHLEAVAS